MIKNSKIKSIKAKEILDSRGNPTIQVNLETNDGLFISSVPSGASTGKNEAVELRDGGKRYLGKGVLQAVKNINEIIAPKIIGESPLDQEKIDNLMKEIDGTENKSHLGANAILAVSIAISRAGAAGEGMSLYQYLAKIYGNSLSDLKMPKACFNILNGGAHAGNELDIQEFMIIPQNNYFKDNLQQASEIYHKLKKIISDSFSKEATNVGDEGGFAPPIKEAEEALNLIGQTIKDYPETKIGIDCAASQFYKDGSYNLAGHSLNQEELSSFYGGLIENYPIIFLEDPFDEEDWSGFRAIEEKLGNKIMIIGDDLLCTNPQRIKKAGEEKACSGTIIKPNQIGTVSEAIEAIKLAKSFGWKTIASHRSGETCDSFIADLAVGAQTDFIKSGAPARGERLAKYNRLLEIEREIKSLN